MKKIIATERLILREFELSDAEAFYKLNENPEVLKYTGDKAFKTINEARYFLKNYNEYNQTGFGRWAVIEKTSNTFIGFCGLKLNEEALVDLGFRFLEKTWGKGYATEAASAALDIGFHQFNLETIVGRADTANIASLKVLEKIGMSFWKYGATDHIGTAAYYKISQIDYLKAKNI